MKLYDLNYLREISGGDDEFILDMIQTFVTASPGEISALKEFALNKEWTLMGEHAHKFAPSLEFLGLSSLKPVINQIEDFSFNRKNLELIPSLIQRLETECSLVSEELKKDFNL